MDVEAGDTVEQGVRREDEDGRETMAGVGRRLIGMQESCRDVRKGGTGVADRKIKWASVGYARDR